MKKIIVIFSLLIFSCATTSNYYSFDNALAVGAERIQGNLPEGTQVAILDFKSGNENLSSYIIEEMYDKLINFGKLTIMERSRTNTIAMEVGYQLSGEVDDNEIVKIGHQLGADFVVTGDITFSGEAYRLRVIAIDIEKGSRVSSSSLNINPKDRQVTHLSRGGATGVIKLTPSEIWGGENAYGQGGSEGISTKLTIGPQLMEMGEKDVVELEVTLPRQNKTQWGQFVMWNDSILQKLKPASGVRFKVVSNDGKFWTFGVGTIETSIDYNHHHIEIKTKPMAVAIIDVPYSSLKQHNDGRQKHKFIQDNIVNFVFQRFSDTIEGTGTSTLKVFDFEIY